MTPNGLSQHLTLAHDLGARLAVLIRGNERYGGAEVAGQLDALRKEIWGDHSHKPAVERDKHKIFKSALGIKGKKRDRLLEAYARLGHLYELAGLLTREQYFASLKKSGESVPGGTEAFVSHQESAAEAVAKLNRPVFEVVMTMHPTITDSVAFMRAKRGLAEAVASGDERKIQQAMETFQTTPILHQAPREKDAKPRDANFTVRDETEVVLNALGNVYDDLPRIYEQFDAPLETKFGAQYDKLTLRPDIRFGSWGSAGDKDGNDNVTAEATLEAIALHTVDIVDRYKNDLEKLPGLEGWKAHFNQVSGELHKLLPRIEALRAGAIPVRRGEMLPFGADLCRDFDELSGELARLRGELKDKKIGGDNFAESLQAAFQAVPAPQEKQDTLNLLRRVRTFGYNFAKIEYRETAKEYRRVVEALVPGYEKISVEKRIDKLTKILSGEGGSPEEMLAARRDALARDGASRPYDDNDPQPIAYHTWKRMELARDFSDMIEDSVLAECGKTQSKDAKRVKAEGVANMLEALFVQRMVKKDGREARLGIVPLFEEPSTMENIDGIMAGAYHNRAYQAHLEALKDRHGGRKTQQVQIAHSDNARRSGLQAARAYIHEAHKKIRRLNEAEGIATQFFEGGSISDAYRNGVRAVSAAVEAFGLHDFAKFTFQGGDLVNYFNLPGSNERVFTRNIVHGAEMFEREERRGPGHNRMPPNGIMDDVAIAALKKTWQDYAAEDFKTNTMGVLLAALDYDGETKAGNHGSRASSRGSAFGKVGKVELGTLVPVKIDKVRTIGFSEAWQHAGIIPSWIGSQRLAEYLHDELVHKVQDIREHPKMSEQEKEFLEQVKRSGSLSADMPLTPGQIHMFYQGSPTFKDAQDRAAHALAMTDPEALKWLERRLEREAEAGEKRAAKGQKVPQGHAGYVAQAQRYMAGIMQTHKKAGTLALAAQKGEPANGHDVQRVLTESLERLTDDIRNKIGYRDFLLYAKLKGSKMNDALSDHQRSIVHNAGDTVVHGRFLCADDPAYGKALKQQQEVVMGLS